MRLIPGIPSTPKGLNTLISSVHEVRPVKNWRTCDPRRQNHLASDLTGWLATAAVADPIRVTVVVPDDTRPLPPSLIIPPVLDAIAEAGRRRGAPIDATILVATGLHKAPSTEWMNELGRATEVFKRDPMINVDQRVHDTSVPDERRLPIHPLVMPERLGGQTDRVVTIGLVEPHQYAGFSGGSKALTIGCGSSRTIAELHSLKILRREGVTIGRAENNPFRKELDRKAARFAAPTFSIALVPDPTDSGQIAGLFAGASNRPFKAAVSMARRILLAPVQRHFDFALISVPPAKAQNFYQASRALTYLALHSSPCVNKGGTLVLQAGCPEGYGLGKGEQAFKEALSRGRSRLLEELRGKKDPPDNLGGGAQRAYVLARAMARFRCVLVGAGPLPEAVKAGLIQIPDLSEARLAGAGLIVDDPFVLMPYHDAREGAALDQLVELSDRAPGSTA